MGKKSLVGLGKNMAEKKYKIKITPKANDDLDEIYSYIAKELVNEAAAENLMDKIEEKMIYRQMLEYRHSLFLPKIICKHIETKVIFQLLFCIRQCFQCLLRSKIECIQVLLLHRNSS